jgi:hypothetical protein
MSEGAVLVRFHDWRAHGLVAVPVSIGLATLVLAVGQVMLLHPAAYSGAEVQHRLLTYRIIKEICNAARELARFPAPFFSVLPDLFVAGDDPSEIHSLAPGVATSVGRCGRGRFV